MSTKLTLSIDENVIREAKEYAQKTGRSVSQLVENYLKAITSSSIEKKQSSVPPLIKRLHGCIKTDETKSYREIYGDILEDKFGVK